MSKDRIIARSQFESVQCRQFDIIECGGHKWYRSTGLLMYEPNKSVVLYADPELCRYYCNRIFKHTTLNLMIPRLQAHITVVSGKWEMTNKETFARSKRRFHKKFIPFYYSSTVFTEGPYYWLSIHSHTLIEVRASLGLGPRYHPLHLTIGNKKHLI